MENLAESGSLHQSLLHDLSASVSAPHNQCLVDVSDILNFLSARGGGKGRVRGIPGGGGGFSRRGRGRGAGRVSAANWGIGGGLNIFFRGRNVHRDYLRKSLTNIFAMHVFDIGG